MSLFSDIERTIERGFRHWTERVLGEARSDELVLVHRAILEEIEGKIRVAARGRRIFPYGRLTVTLASEDAERRAVYQAAFAEGGRLESDMRQALEAAGCELPAGFAVEVRTVESGAQPFAIEYAAAPASPAAPVPAAEAPREEPRPVAVAGPARLVVVKGKAGREEYTLDKARTNIGRLAELTDSEHRVVRRNDVVFEEGGDEANGTVSRRHAHIRLEAGEYRVIDDESEFGTRVFRDGRPVEVPAGNRRGERLRPGDEIYLGRACLRFER
jgi:pSer/pThr/pTyr-binding forkhead associated (FHA) protein